MISDRIRKIVFVDHDNQQSGKAAGNNVMWSSVSTKDVGNLTYLRHAMKILDCTLTSVGHAQGLHLPTRIDSVRLRSSSGWSHHLAFGLLRRSTGWTARFMDFIIDQLVGLFGVHFYSALTSPLTSWLGCLVLNFSPTSWSDCSSLHHQLR